MPTLQVRDLPVHIYNKIVAQAEAQRRSISQQTIILLEKALDYYADGHAKRETAIDDIVRDTQSSPDVPDPVKLIREDRDR